MLLRQGEVNIFITDESIGIYQSPIKKTQSSKNAIIELEDHIVENGYIIDPNALLLKIKTLFKSNNIKPKSINMTIHDQNLLIREFVIHKEDLQKKSILSFIHDQEGKTIHYPFEEANITYYIKSEDESKINVVVIISDENLLHDYHDIFDALGINRVSFNIVPRVLYRLYENESPKKLDQLMVVSVFNNMITVNILEQGIPVFGMIEEVEGNSKQYYDMVENYIERVANYYKFNIRKGAFHVSDIVLFNFNKMLSNEELKHKIKPEIENLSLDVYQLKQTLSGDENVEQMCTMAYASSIKKEENQAHIFNFNLDRIKKINRYANYLLVLAFTIFTAVALIYIPYISANEDINVQTNINNILQNQLDILKEDTPNIPDVSLLERDYSNAYDFLIGQIDHPSNHIEDLMDELSGSLAVSRFSINTENNEIVILITATSEGELYEYLLNIYEAYGVTDGLDQTRWMAEQPSRRFISSLLMEVTVYYA
ncbi:MAG: hypothetical protein K9L02_03915 [Acholeplasmataceae bacterium]|nr:hypothetical protein [Acholeplasmataceae bacterium]